MPGWFFFTRTYSSSALRCCPASTNTCKISSRWVVDLSPCPDRYSDSCRPAFWIVFIIDINIHFPLVSFLYHAWTALSSIFFPALQKKGRPLRTPLLNP